LHHEKLRAIVASKLILDWSQETGFENGEGTTIPSNERHGVFPRKPFYPQLVHPGPGEWLKGKSGISANQVKDGCTSLTRHYGATGQSSRSDRRCHSIREKTAEVEGPGAIPGHWEGDLLSGSRKIVIIATWSETTFSRFTMLGQKCPAKIPAMVVAGDEQANRA